MTSALDAVGLRRVMAIESGWEEVSVALLDGPVAVAHPSLDGACVRGTGSKQPTSCRRTTSFACRHGTFIAGILSARRGRGAPGICPGCVLLVRPIFSEDQDGTLPGAAPREVANAISESLDAGAELINISAALGPTVGREPQLDAALEISARRGAIVIAAAGNDGTLGSSPLTRHVGVIPVTACDAAGRPMRASTVGRSHGLRGVSAPGAVMSLSPQGPSVALSGSSFAAALVTGACALLRSAFRTVPAHEIVRAVRGSGRRTSVVPPLLDAWAAYQRLAGMRVA